MSGPHQSSGGNVPISRRRWLAGASAGLVGPSAFADGDDETKATEAVEERAAKAGVKALQTRQSRHYLVVGNAPADYLRIILVDCETLALDFLEHFRAKGFAIDFPEEKLIAVALENEREFVKFLNMHANTAVVGVYLARDNWLVVQDYRRVPRTARDLPVWADNLHVLAHEGTHQLSFNTGLLNRRGDVPRCVSEGLAMYGEYRRPNVRMAPGQINKRRLDDLAHLRRGLDWLPVAELLGDRGWWTAGDGAKLLFCYAESWLLVHFLMKNPERLPGFRDFLKAIYPRKEGGRRLDDAREHWGDLARLDQDLKRYAIELLHAR